MTTPHAAVDQIISALSAEANQDPELIAAGWSALEASGTLDYITWEHWLNTLVSLAPVPVSGADGDALLARTLERLHTAMLGPSGFTELPESLEIHKFPLWYARLTRDSTGRGRLPAMLARDSSPDALATLFELWNQTPASDDRSTDLVFATLVQRKSPHLKELFPRLFDLAATPSFAAACLDLANFLFRSGEISTHPAAERLPRFVKLLQGIVVELERIEKDPVASGSPVEVQAKIAASISLGVALCDCFALTRYEPAAEQLKLAMCLGHRRLRCEAAWGLARLNDDSGVTELIMLAEEPVARLRVLAYADELGVTDRVPGELRTDEAIAESELAIWLADPTQMGLPPGEMSCVDLRRLSWPGFDEPIECRLWKFTYDFGRGQYQNIGITGPRAQAVTVDLIGLPFDEVYSLFAGLQAEHEEILEQDVRELAPGHAPEIARLERRLRDRGLEEIQPLKFGSFFGERVLIARARSGATRGLAVADSLEVLWRPDDSRSRPLGADECHAIYRGRKLLGAFNEGFIAGDVDR